MTTTTHQPRPEPTRLTTVPPCPAPDPLVFWHSEAGRQHRRAVGAEQARAAQEALAEELFELLEEMEGQIKRQADTIIGLQKAEQERDELRDAMKETAPAEVCVRDLWFKPSELPEALGRAMDARDEAQREAKEYYLRASKAKENATYWENTSKAQDGAIGRWKTRTEKAEQERDDLRGESELRAAVIEEERASIERLRAEVSELRAAQPAPLTLDAITDEMVDRAAHALEHQPETGSIVEDMRAVLTAAFTEAAPRPEWRDEAESQSGGAEAPVDLAAALVRAGMAWDEFEGDDVTAQLEAAVTAALSPPERRPAGAAELDETLDAALRGVGLTPLTAAEIRTVANNLADDGIRAGGAR